MTDKIQAALTAATVAAEAAATAATAARDVASKAADTAASVAIMASKSTESVLLLGQEIKFIREDVADIKKKLESVYVTQDQFVPVRNIAFGMVGTLLLAVLGAIAKLIFIK